MATGRETQFDSPLKTLLIELPRGFGFQQPRQQHQGSSWDQSCPGTPESDAPTTVLLSSTPLFLLKMTKSNKKHFGSPFGEKTIPPPKAAATDGEGRARGAWLPAGVWAKFMLGQLG